jgi:CRP-like cAMP-binding protein
MRVSPPPSAAGRNQLLQLLRGAEYERLRPHLTIVSLRSGQNVIKPSARVRYVYFPQTAVFSVISVMRDNRAAEVGTVGNEGFVGLSVFLGADSMPSECLAQVAGDASRMEADAFRGAVAGSPALAALMGRYTQAFMVQVAQTAACNALHSLGQRCARWLLMTDDRVANGHGFELTQQYLSYMLGVRREGVSGAAKLLQEAGLIRYSRGHVVITDRPGLEKKSCECYAVVRAEHDRIIEGNGRRARRLSA